MAKGLSLVARRIKEIREAKGLTRQELADKLGCTYLQVYRVEEGKVHVAAEDVPGFAAALDVSPASFYRESKAAS